MSTTNYYFMRHCISEYNESGNQYPNVQLSENGIKQAINIGKDNINIKFDIVLCSPLKRCLQTLEYTNFRYDKLFICEEIREIRESNIIDYFDNEVIINETKEEIETRINKFVRILNLYKEKGYNVLIISHYSFYHIMSNKQNIINNGEIVYMNDKYIF